MKKVLLGTSALIAAGFVAAPAMAQEKIQLGIGGKMEQYFGVVSQDDDEAFDSNVTGINTDTEIYFTGAATLDNGLTVGAVIQLEAQTSNDTNADEQYAYIEGSFGRIQAGQKDGVASQLAHEAPQIGLADDDIASWFTQANLDQNRTYANIADTTAGSDDATVSYITPSLAGFSAGVSYTPTPGGALVADQDSVNTDGIEVAVAYNGEFSGVGIGADVAYSHQNAPDGSNMDDPSYWRAGLVTSFGGFSVGGSYIGFDNEGDDSDSYAWNAGVAYETGPFGVGLTYLNSEVEAGPSDTDDYQQVYLSGSYAMGPGISLVGGLFWAEGEQNTDVVGGDDDEDDAAGAVVGLALSF